MKKRKNFGLYGTNKRRRPKRNERFDIDYENYDEEDGDYADAADEDDEYIVDYQTDYNASEDRNDANEHYTADDDGYYEGEGYGGGTDGAGSDYEGEYYADEAYVNDESAGYADAAYADDESAGYADEAYMAEDENADYAEEDESTDYTDEAYIAEDESAGYEDELYAEEDESTGYADELYAEDEGIAYAEDDSVDYANEDYSEDDGMYFETDEYGEGYDEEDEYYDSEPYDEDEYEPNEYGSENESGFFAVFADKIKAWAANLTAFDLIVAATGIMVVAAGIITFGVFHQGKKIEERIAAIAPVGDELINIGVAGDDGLIAMTGAALSGQFVVGEAVTEEASDAENENEASQPSKVSVSFVSVEKDLKIRFTDSETGELITGTAFEVVLTSSKGKQLVLTDDDMDGIIYATNVTPGVFEAVVTSTDKYKFPSAAQQVTVKDKVEYVVINIQDEVKKESQVNVAAEDTQKQDAAKEEVKLTDTVEWVESTSTPIGGTENYILVDKDTIADPSQAAMLGKKMFFEGLNVTFDSARLSLFVNGTAQLKVSQDFKDSESDTEKVEYSYKWESSRGDIVSVDGSGASANIMAKASGTANITCTVTKTTTPITYEGGEPTQSREKIDEEEYNELLEKCKKEGKDESKEIAKEGDGDDVKYYKIVEELTEKTKKYGEPVTELQGKADCEVTVKKGIKSGTLELKKSADSCAVGATLTVSPSKLEYRYDDDSTQTLTEGFPAITWSIADTDKEEVATINDKGVVTGVKTGSTTIKGVATVKNSAGNDISIEATVTVSITDAPVFSLVLDRTDNVYLAVGGETTLVATVENAKSDSGVTWTTSDKKIATVDENGKVTGVAAGSATITATTKEKNADGKQLTASCKVTVNSDAVNDTTTKLKDKNGNQIYIKDSDGNYKEAVYADYYTAKEFYLRTEGQFAYTGWQTINGKTYYYDKNGNAVTGTQIIQGVTYNFGSDGAIATTVNGSTFGIDISRHNGNIDWNAVKASGVDYVILRCGYRGSATGVLIEDESFKKNIKGATAAGLKVGVYVFSQAVDEVEAVKEASLAVSLVKGYKLTYPIFIDTESSGGRADKIDKATRTAVVNAFCQTVASAGYQAGIYASKTWFEDKLNMGAVGSYRIWLAQYAAQPTYKSRYDMWQYSSKGTISGIKGDVDLNWSYMGY